MGAAITCGANGVILGGAVLLRIDVVPLIAVGDATVFALTA